MAAPIEPFENASSNDDNRQIDALASEALFVQSACNLSGVVHSFSRAMKRLRVILPNQGTDFYNKHPICVLFATQIAHLTGIDGESEVYSKAYDECKKWSGEQDG